MLEEEDRGGNGHKKHTVINGACHPLFLSKETRNQEEKNRKQAHGAMQHCWHCSFAQSLQKTYKFTHKDLVQEGNITVNPQALKCSEENIFVLYIIVLFMI